MYKRTLLSLSATFTALFPSVVIAQCDSSQEICNPLQVDSISEFLHELVDAITYLAIPVIVVFIIYAGFLFVTAGGDESQLKTAKNTAVYTLIGASIILAADLLSEVLRNTATNIGVDGLD